jgi:hypothetical protein
VSIFYRINQMPVVIKFALGAGGVLVLFLLVIEPLLDAQSDLSARAERARVALAGYVEDANERTRLSAQVSRGEERYGPVAMPASFEERSAELDESIRTILDENAIERESIVTRFNAMPRGTLQDILASGQSVELIIKTIRFDATPEELANVVAALEESPSVVGISHIDIRRDREGQRRVLVDLTVDGWVIERQGAGR